MVPLVLYKAYASCGLTAVTRGSVLTLSLELPLFCTYKAVFFNLFSEVEPFAAILIAHGTLVFGGL